MRPKEKKLFWMSVAALHLFLVALGANRVRFTPEGLPSRVAGLYNDLSGASSNYEFFSPGITDQSRVRFEMVDERGRRSHVELAARLNQEAMIRFDTILHGILDEDESEGKPMTHTLFSSYAANLFALHPEAREIAVKLESFTPVSMAEFRRGERPEWQSDYEIRFGYTPPVTGRKVSR